MIGTTTLGALVTFKIPSLKSMLPLLVNPLFVLKNWEVLGLLQCKMEFFKGLKAKEYCSRLDEKR